VVTARLPLRGLPGAIGQHRAGRRADDENARLAEAAWAVYSLGANTVVVEDLLASGPSSRVWRLAGYGPGGCTRYVVKWFRPRSRQAGRAVATEYAALTRLGTALAAAPAGIGPTGVMPPGIAPTGIAPAGIAPTGIVPAGIAAAGIAAAGIVPAGIAPTGIVPAGIAPTGIVPVGVAPGYRVCCPAPVQVWDWGYAMTAVPGQRLDRAVAGAMVPGAGLGGLARDLIGALRAYHATEGRPHGDVEPGRVLIAPGVLSLLAPATAPPAGPPMAVDLAQWVAGAAVRVLRLAPRHPRRVAVLRTLTADLACAAELYEPGVTIEIERCLARRWERLRSQGPRRRAVAAAANRLVRPPVPAEPPAGHPQPPPRPAEPASRL
jgi:hypothetical protein